MNEQLKKNIYIYILFILLGILNSAQDAILNLSVIKKWLNTSNNDFGDKYKLTCEVGLADLKGTSLLDKARFVGKNINQKLIPMLEFILMIIKIKVT